MDTIQEALQQLHLSRYAIGGDLTQEHLARAQVLATISLAEQLEKLNDKMTDKELSNSKRIIITVNDETTQDQVDTLTQAITLMADQLKITAVIVYEQA